jgi:hypothetical protein
MPTLDLMIDVTSAAGLGENASIALTVHLPVPEELSEVPVVCSVGWLGDGFCASSSSRKSSSRFNERDCK